MHFLGKCTLIASFTDPKTRAAKIYFNGGSCAFNYTLKSYEVSQGVPYICTPNTPLWSWAWQPPGFQIKTHVLLPVWKSNWNKPLLTGQRSIFSYALPVLSRKTATFPVPPSTVSSSGSSLLCISASFWIGSPFGTGVHFFSLICKPLVNTFFLKSSFIHPSNAV